MTNQTYKFRFIERILHLLRLLEEKHWDIDWLLDGNLPSGQFTEEEEMLFQTALECIRFMEEIPGGFFIYRATEDEQLLYANPEVLRMFLCSSMKEFRELTGNSFRGIVYPDDLSRVEASIHRQILSSRYDLDYVEYRIRRSDGSIRWVNDYGHLVRDTSVGDVFYVFLGNPSNDQIHQQIQELTNLSEKADLAIKAKNTFLSQISHEMRTPLNAIFGFTTLARLSLNEPEVIAGYLEQIESASQQLLHMITQALDVSALSGASSFLEEECDLCSILQEIYDYLLPQAQEKNLLFSLQCEKTIHRSVYTDAKRLRQMILNLVNNAITYTDSGGSVSIVLTEEEMLPDNVTIYRLEVQDTGIGMEQSYLEHLFEPFSREKSSTLSRQQGIGLGLTLVKNIVDLLGGTISVKTAVNEGSTFTVMLSFHIKPDTPAQPSRLRILLVEDNEINREIETELLERKGFLVDAVEDGHTALRKIQSASSDEYGLILLDLQMPGMDGWEVAAAIRNLPDPALAHIPIIALSANVQFKDRRRSLESGIDVHLAKPMNLDILLETIEKITKRPLPGA